MEGTFLLSNKNKQCGYNTRIKNMTIITPNTTGSVSFLVYPRPTASYDPFSVVIHLDDAETYVNTTYTDVTASINSNDFLSITASLNLSGSNFYTMKIVQMSGSTECNELYRGVIYATTESATVRNSEPYMSYTGSTQDYIIF